MITKPKILSFFNVCTLGNSLSMTYMHAVEHCSDNETGGDSCVMIRANLYNMLREKKLPNSKHSPFSCIQLFATPWTVAHQAPLSLGFSTQEYWSGLPCLSPGDLSDPGIEPVSPVLAGRFFTAEPQGSPTGMSSHSLLQGSS